MYVQLIFMFNYFVTLSLIKVNPTSRQSSAKKGIKITFKKKFKCKEAVYLTAQEGRGFFSLVIDSFPRV